LPKGFLQFGRDKKTQFQIYYPAPKIKDFPQKFRFADGQKAIPGVLAAAGRLQNCSLLKAPRQSAESLPAVC
jgi:hypothetical protein